MTSTSGLHCRTEAKARICLLGIIDPVGFAIATVLLAVMCSAAAAPNRGLAIANFTTHRDLCDHFRGEEPYDAARASEIAAKVKRYCTGTDRELRRLRKRYAHNPRVLQRLSAYEDTIE
jgi:hypothetical protein